MTKDQAKGIIRRLKAKGEEPRIYENYSGRFMYGEKTCGVVIGRYSSYQNKKFRSDNLGLDTIIY